MPITAIYAGVLGLFLIFLSVRVIGIRRAARIGLGDGGDTVLMRAVRAHANFAEYAPFTLIVMALVESLGAPALLLHAGGASLAAGRIIHALGVSRSPELPLFRVAGMAATLTALSLLAVCAIYFGVHPDPGGLR